MSGTRIPFIVETDSGPLSDPAWTLDMAVQSARDAETAGSRASRIRRGIEIVLEGDALRKALESDAPA